MSSIRNDHEVARDLATEAGQQLLRLRDRHGFEEPEVLRTLGDRLSHEFLFSALERLRPSDAVLSEEGVDDRRRLSARRVWIIDPLDGTREFAEAGRGDWAVHVALWENGELVAGAVSLPAQGSTLSTVDPPWLPEERPSDQRLRITTSRTRPPEFVQRLATQLGAEVLPMGSAGAKICAVLLGIADIYLHAGGQYEWDSAAPVAVAHAAGLHASRIDGSKLTYNEVDPSLPDILVCRPELSSMLLASVREVADLNSADPHAGA
ncbi:3'(2'),5'-bisphosphate nucleotidase CysQ [Marinitenerispora sediminis]|uniref:3'(2'),5'-bisphosphate nucleotidase CysQ n=1 Tax=Marinitenerispora sediminis TaxID=1931232 RepID=A0A368T8D5_9ACTN|nr:3'(2'),5'-bisphosphate nucleotidase CysQ [Marinitenerispora sediminis]RCV56037.1 3'(2'),5'-bisphosphate nucleotidase CysQ [Marinitenerispora sediminis]RCV60233.1 3'(2'),5'-bisphosphate nucleotidase CysQ [Marinitenerispora sediminis]RCV60975.1 3'(2'),5'-bisphosphate nucleotidase CysQ [Marinitenerispora sediminis]